MWVVVCKSNSRILGWTSCNVVRGYKLTKRNQAVVEYTGCHVKTKSKPTNLKINSRIEGYNGK